MSYLSQQKMMGAAKRRKLSQGNFVPTPTAGEAFGLAFEETTELEMLSSRRTITKRAQDWQKRQLRDLHEQGEIPDEIWEKSVRRVRRGGEMDWEEVAGWTNENLDTNYDFSYGYVAEQALENTQARQETMQTYGMFSSQGVMSFLGTGAAMFNPAKPVDLMASAALAAIPGGPVAASSVMKTVSNVALKEAGIGLLEEGLTQINSFQLRNDIGDEYQVSEAVANVMAGMVIQGSLGALISIPGSRRVVEQAREVSRKADVNAEAEDLQEALRVLSDTLKEKEQTGRTVLDATALPSQRQINVPDEAATRESVLTTAREELLPVAGRKLSRGQVKATKQEITELKQRLNEVEDTPTPKPTPEDTRHVSKRRQKRQAERRGKKLAEQDRERLNARIDKLERQLADNEVAAKAEADLSRVEQGIIPDEYRELFDSERDLVSKLETSREAPPTQIMGPLDPLLPEQRAALDDIDMMVRMLEDVDFTKQPMTAAQAKQWLSKQWEAYTTLHEAVPEASVSAKRIATETDSAPFRGADADADNDVTLDMSADEAFTSAQKVSETTVETDDVATTTTRFRENDKVTTIRRTDGEDAEIVETTWGEIVGAERARLTSKFERADAALACIRGET